MNLPRTTLAMPLALAMAAHAQDVALTFDGQEAGEAPKGLTCPLTGMGRPGTWLLERDEGAPSKPLALAQTDGDGSRYRFPHSAVHDVPAAETRAGGAAYQLHDQHRR